MQKARRHSLKAAPTACKRTVSGSVALRCPRFFSPFPHGTGPLSVSQEYLALADGTAGFGQDFPGPALLRIRLRSNSISNTRLSRSMAILSRMFFYQIAVDIAVLQPRARRDAPGLGSSAFARHYLRNHCCFLFLQVLRCFSSLRSPHIVVMCLQHIGFPHSDIRGSKVICTSPRLFAACHVLPRL